MNQHHIAATSSAGSELSLLDVLVRQTSAPVAGSVQRLTMAIDADVLHSLDARAARLGTTPVLLRRAALALLESRFTGQAEIVLGTAQGNIFHKVPSEGTVDAWLLTHTTPAVAEDGTASAVGAWSDDAPAHASLPLRWSLSPRGDHIELDYDTAVFDESMLLTLAHALSQLLHALAHRDALESIRALDQETYERVIARWNDTAMPRRLEDTVHGLFADVALAHLTSIALDGPWGALTYGQLDASSHRVAAGLIHAGVTPGAVVGLLLDRSPDAIVAILGILKAGAAYLPLDRANPADRLAFVLQDAHVAAIIVAEGMAIPEGVAAPVLDIAALMQSGDVATLPMIDGNALAYVMYTSGSTGTPKGVEIRHRSIIRLVRDVRYVAFGESPRVLHAAPLGFVGNGRSIEDTSSPGCRIVRPGPTKKSVSGTRRPPARPTTLTRAP